MVSIDPKFTNVAVDLGAGLGNIPYRHEQSNGKATGRLVRQGFVAAQQNLIAYWPRPGVAKNRTVGVPSIKGISVLLTSRRV
ncbi:hypothetical protein [Paeniglutamicibacter sp.]|uniref:hypothetical protein n=1 Tax=Paeniglutamicibacter sp. TaxID=1934391 RepID=UPI0039895CE8